MDRCHVLTIIGPRNLSFLRDIRFNFEDASVSTTHYLTSHEDRRFVNDQQLMECLRLLRHAKLRKIALLFQGRRTLALTDSRFLGYLCQVKADVVDVSKRRYIYPSYNNKLTLDVEVKLEKEMTRNPKLYAADP